MKYKSLEHAVKASLEVWKELARTGCEKNELPPSLRHEIVHNLAECPLCEYFDKKQKGGLQLHLCWRYCPLEGCFGNTSWNSWKDAESIELKKYYAQEIVDKLEEWVWYGQLYQDYTETELREQ